MPLAFSCPQIWEGFESLMRFHTTELAEGCWKVVVSPAAMLKDFQLRKAFWEVWIVSCVPLAVAEAWPLTTVIPRGLANALRATPRAAVMVRKHDQPD
jgi:hypothetical protein